MTTPTPPDFSDASKWRTRGGRKVRIYAADGGDQYPIHGAIFTDGRWVSNSWSRDGEDGCYRICDLIPAPPERKRLTVWLNLYRDNVAAYYSEIDARKWAAPDCIAIVKVEPDFIPGHGIDGADESGKGGGK